jgi:hypothetical protein
MRAKPSSSPSHITVRVAVVFLPRLDGAARRGTSDQIKGHERWHCCVGQIAQPDPCTVAANSRSPLRATTPLRTAHYRLNRETVRAAVPLALDLVERWPPRRTRDVLTSSSKTYAPRRGMPASAISCTKRRHMVPGPRAPCGCASCSGRTSGRTRGCARPKTRPAGARPSNAAARAARTGLPTGGVVCRRLQASRDSGAPRPCAGHRGPLIDASCCGRHRWLGVRHPLP